MQINERLDVREEVEGGPAGALELVDEQHVAVGSVGTARMLRRGVAVVLGRGASLLDIEDHRVRETLRGDPKLGPGQVTF